MKSLILVATLALSLVISLPMMSLAQEETSTENQIPENIDVPLNFTLKVKGGGEENATEGGKDLGVTLKLQSSEGGSPTDLPLKTKISNDTKLQDIELCGAMSEGKQMCQTLEKFVSEKEQNQTSGASSNETENNNGNEDN
jgi:hypothetical protein